MITIGLRMPGNISWAMGTPSFWVVTVKSVLKNSLVASMIGTRFGMSPVTRLTDSSL